MTESEIYLKIKDLTDISILEDMTNDFLIDIIDNIDGIKTRAYSGINFRYKRPGGRGRTDGLNFDWFENYSESGVYNFNGEAKRHLKSIYDKIEHAEKITSICEYSYTIDENVEYDNFINEFTNLEKICEYNDIKLRIGFSIPVISDIRTFLLNLKLELEKYSSDPEFDFSKRWKSYLKTIRTVRLKFSKKIDENVFKSDYTIEDKLPKNIIADFTEFTNKFRMSTRDKKQLINILRKADWDSIKE